MLASKRLALLSLLGISFLVTGCDAWTEVEEDVRVKLNSFQIIGTPEGAVQTRAALIGNPACTPTPINLDSLLAEADNYDKIDSYLETLDVNHVRFRIHNNTTPIAANVELMMSDPASGDLVIVASSPVAEGQTIGEWTKMPFTADGRRVIQHYMDNLGKEFMYCGQVDPDNPQVSLGFDIQMDLTVTLDLI